ncbi:MAG: hypothetical protein LRY66_09245 [Saccharospirillaceae bacterium]|nr:hypothetical protein [Saccharospirillaceae bacterium]
MFDFLKRKKNAPEATKETPAHAESPESSIEQAQADITEQVTDAVAEHPPCGGAASGTGRHC